MIQGEPKWWKVLLKEPGYWLIGLTLIGMLGAMIVGTIVDSIQDDKNKQQKIEQTNETKNNTAQ